MVAEFENGSSGDVADAGRCLDVCGGVVGIVAEMLHELLVQAGEQPPYE